MLIIAIFLILALCIFRWLYVNHVRVHFKTFFKKGIKFKDDDYGLYVFYTYQGGGKTFSCIDILRNAIGKKKIITNVESFYKNYKDTVTFEDDFQKLIDFLLSKDDLSDTFVFYDEIFSYFDEVGLPKDASDVFTQLRKKRLHFFTTSQVWTELPKKFRKLCRFEVSCRVINLPFLPFSILVNEFNDGYQIKWDNDTQSYVCPRLWTSYKKCTKQVAEAYDTYETVRHIKPAARYNARSSRGGR